MFLDADTLCGLRTTLTREDLRVGFEVGLCVAALDLACDLPDEVSESCADMCVLEDPKNGVISMVSSSRSCAGSYGCKIAISSEKWYSS